MERIKNKIIIYIITTLSLSIFLSNNTFAENMPTTVYLKPSLTLSIPTSTIDLTLDPSSTPFSSDSISIEVGTNNILGYRLYVSTVDNSTNLVHIVDNTKTISTLPSSGSTDCSTGCTESQFPANHWGYSLDTSSDRNYLPFTSGALVSSSNGPVNSSTTTFTVGAKVDYTKDSGIYQTNLQFSTVPAVAVHYMQDLKDPTLAERVCTTDAPTLVADSRDNKTYYIRRLADGKCWMIQNLRLGEDLAVETGSMTLTPNDSNVMSDFVLTNKLSNGDFPQIYIDDPDTSLNYDYKRIWDASAFYCRSDYGCYYNWYTATASSGSSEITTHNGNVDDSICPNGWALPTAGTSDSEYVMLVDLYEAGANPNKILVSPISAVENTNGSFAPGFVLSGAYYNGTNPGAYFGKTGYWWSRTNNTVSTAYFLIIATSGNQANGYSRYGKSTGRSVRCLLQE